MYFFWCHLLCSFLQDTNFIICWIDFAHLPCFFSTVIWEYLCSFLCQYFSLSLNYHVPEHIFVTFITFWFPLWFLALQYFFLLLFLWYLSAHFQLLLLFKNFLLKILCILFELLFSVFKAFYIYFFSNKEGFFLIFSFVSLGKLPCNCFSYNCYSR